MSPVAPRRRARRALRFAPLAFLKLQFLCHAGPTEVGTFGISSEEDLLYVQDVVTVRQDCTAVTTRFLDEAVADHVDRCADLGIPPQRSTRIWCHSHPEGVLARPSSVDESTFSRAFGASEWAVMAILSRTGRTYARLQINTGPGAVVPLRWAVDWSSWPTDLEDADLTVMREKWAWEFSENVIAMEPAISTSHADQTNHPYFATGLGRYSLPERGTRPDVAELDEWYAGSYWRHHQNLFDPYSDPRGDDRVYELP